LRRPRTRYSFATLAALVALTTALSACGGDGGSTGSAGEVIDSATLQGVESGKLDLAVELSAKGEDGGNLNLNVSGAFQGEGRGELPQLDGSATAKGKIGGRKIDFDGGLVLLPNSAYVNYEGTEYEVDPTTYSFVESALKQAQREGGGEGEDGGTTACQEEFGGLKFREFIENAETEGSADVGGESTTKVGGELDVPALLDQGVEIAESPACSAQLSAAGELPSGDELDEAKDEVEKAVKRASVELYVGDDGIVRRFVIQAQIEPQNGGDGPSRVDLDLDLRLTEVNEEQQISAPGGKAKPLSDLFIKLDVNPIELLEQLQGEGEAGQLDFEGLLEGLGEAAR
jgi:hypothetical protein